MKSLLLLTTEMTRLCYADSDLARIDALGNLYRADAAGPGELEAAWERYAGKVETVITGWDSLAMTEARLAMAPGVRLIAHSAGSVKPIVTDAVWERDIRVTSANGALAIGVAETTLGLIITGLKGIYTTGAHTRTGGWKRGGHGISGFPVRELFDVTIGIIGAGAIGRHLITLLKPFSVHILLYDPFVTEQQAAQMGVTLAPLDRLMSQSQVVSLHAPALPANKHMLGAAQFKLMQDHAIFINTARGMLVDESALCAELATGRIFAFIDVTAPEPPAPDHPFRTLPNVVLTPHIAGAISNGCQRLGRSIADSLESYVNGRGLPGEVTQDLLARIA